MNHLTGECEQQRSAAGLLRYLSAMGYSISVTEDGQRLFVVGELCEYRRVLIRSHKAELLQLLTDARITTAKLIRGVMC